MELHPSPTELTTAATDAALALVALASLAWLGRRRTVDPARASLWMAVLALLAVASALGAVAHGLWLPERAVHWLWQPLFLSLGWVVALFVVAAVHDGIGAAAARRLLLPAIAVGSVFYLVTLLVPGSFLVFVLYEAVAMLLALGLYGRLAWRTRERWAWLMVAGIGLNIAAAGIQAGGSVRLELGVPFDHNGVFHLVQIVAILVLVAGVGSSLPDSEDDRTHSNHGEKNSHAV